MHDNTDMIKTIWENYNQKMYISKLINKQSLFTKIKLKWPLLGGSRFSIYLHSECRGNQGFNQDSHGISFFKDRLLINHDQFIIQPTHAYIKNQTIKIETCMSKTIMKIN